MKRLALILPLAFLSGCTPPTEMLASTPDVVVDTSAKPEEVRDCFTYNFPTLIVHTTQTGYEVIDGVPGVADADAAFAVKIERTTLGSHVEAHKHVTLTGFSYDWVHTAQPCLDKFARSPRPAG